MWIFLPQTCPACKQPQEYQFKDYNFWLMLSDKNDTAPIDLNFPAPYCVGCGAFFIQGPILDYAQMIAVLTLLPKSEWSGSQTRFLRKFLGFTKQEHADALNAHALTETDVENWEKIGLNDWDDPRLMKQFKDVLKAKLSPTLPNEGRI